MNQFNVTCAVCFDVIASGKGDERPIRHGFSIVTRGWGHGHNGAWHTGPCFGASYPHLGISCEGTKVALKMVGGKIAATKSWLAELATRPVLSWTQEPRRHEAQQGKTAIRHEVKAGARADYSIGRPSYDDLHERETGATERTLKNLQGAKAKYKEVIGSWEPTKYPAEVRGPKVVVMHLNSKWKRTEFPVPLCRAFAMRRPIVSLDVLTNDEAEVTCSLCQRQLASRVALKAKAEARRAKEAASDAKEAAKPQRWFVVAKRWDGLWTVAWIDATTAKASGNADRAPVLAISPATYEDRHTAVQAGIDSARWISGDPRRKRADRWLDVEAKRYTYLREELVEVAS